MQFSREIQRLLVALLFGLVAVGSVAFYWSVFGPEQLLRREDNPRLFEQRAAIERGLIVDRQGVPLVVSVREANNRVRRDYRYTAMNSALGYYSLRYGVSGAEAAYDTLLNGDSLQTDVNDVLLADLLHRPQQGADIQLTLDLRVQNQMLKAMEGQRGAAVVLSVPDGAVLGMISLPTYDPNKLDATWETLVTAPGDPIFNRVLQGQYQPGNIMQTWLVLSGLISGFDLETLYGNVIAPVTVNDVRLTCALLPPRNTLSLAEAYLYGCPAPFARYIQSSVTNLEHSFDLFNFEDQVTLRGFTPEPLPAAETTPEPDSLGLQLEDALGQGDLTITPLHMASLVAALINAGNAPQPYALVAVRPPGETWQDRHTFTPTTPITTMNIARQMQALMRSAVNEGAAQAAQREGLDIGGQVALAYSGEETHTWFIGFARMDVREGVALALVLENTDDLDLAASLGGDILAAALGMMQPELTN
ncbi:MAG: penicillin-binding protein 2 [Anaerolineae bacterium]